MNKSIFYILLLTALPLYFTGCRKEVRPTSMTIKDSVRHYYPIKQGQQLDIMFTITNTGDAPLKVRISSFPKTVSGNSKQPTTASRM